MIIGESPMIIWSSPAVVLPFIHPLIYSEENFEYDFSLPIYSRIPL